MFDKIYGICVDCKEYVFRCPYKRYGDGQLDTDESPVWLLGSIEDIDKEGIKEERISWGWRWRYDSKGKAHRIGIGLYTLNPYRERLFQIPFINRIWIK